MAKAFDQVGIFICQIDASGIAYISINDRNLLMVSIVKCEIRYIFYDWSKNADTNAKLCQIMTNLIPIHRKHTKIIQQQTHFDMLFCLSRQYVNQTLPNFTIMGNKIFHKDKFLCFFKVLKQSFKVFLTLIIIGYTCILIERKSI